MIKLFGQTDNTFQSNGDIVIEPLRAVVHKEDNGDYYLDLTTSLRYADDLTEGRIIIANTPQGEQAFRVSNVQKTKHKINTKCWHVFYDTKNYLIEDSYVTTHDANYALDHLNSATTPASPFTVLSDVQTYNSYRCVRTSYYEAIQTVVEKWGGHLVRDNFSIELRTTIGQDNQVTVRYGKNEKDITVEYNWTDVVTRLLPVGYDGITLTPKYIEATASYNLPYVKCVHFDQSIDQDDYKDENGQLDEDAYHQALIDDLQAQANAYIEVNQYPKVNYTLSANLEKITDIGDAVKVEDERLGVDVMTNVIAFDYDCILDKYISVQFGNFKKELSGLISTVNASAQQMVNESAAEVTSELTDELQSATAQIWGVLGNSYVIYDGDKILVVDRLPKETATNVIMINSAGIAFSNTGISGTFNSAWTIDGKFDAQVVDVINFTANMIKGGTLKLGSNLNQSGTLEVYDEANTLIALMDNTGIKVYGQDGSYVLMNETDGFAGYDRNNNKVFWADYDEFHMKKSVVEEEITLCGRIRFIPITITDGSNNIVNDGVGLVAVGGN